MEGCLRRGWDIALRANVFAQGVVLIAFPGDGLHIAGRAFGAWMGSSEAKERKGKDRVLFSGVRWFGQGIFVFDGRARGCREGLRLRSADGMCRRHEGWWRTWNLLKWDIVRARVEVRSCGGGKCC